MQPNQEYSRSSRSKAIAIAAYLAGTAAAAFGALNSMDSNPAYTPPAAQDTVFIYDTIIRMRTDTVFVHSAAVDRDSQRALRGELEDVVLNVGSSE